MQSSRLGGIGMYCCLSLMLTSGSIPQFSEADESPVEVQVSADSAATVLLVLGLV
jgi:hypothetical protein